MARLLELLGFVRDEIAEVENVVHGSLTGRVRPDAG
jgi:hypothetical protein